VTDTAHCAAELLWVRLLADLSLHLQEEARGGQTLHTVLLYCLGCSSGWSTLSWHAVSGTHSPPPKAHMTAAEMAATLWLY
jgi:hypothetical protein